jgi:very-short-patch-repair endonuclease
MHTLPYQNKLKPLSRNLRNNQTSAEQILWHYLRKKQILNVRFTRQKPIGPYIVDFFAKEKKLVIELDGIDHYETSGIIKDQKRDAFLKSLGLIVLRFNNLEVKCALESVIQIIEYAILGKAYSQDFGGYIELGS